MSGKSVQKIGLFIAEVSEEQIITPGGANPYRKSGKYVI
jgi:hypothetical protein